MVPLHPLMIIFFVFLIKIGKKKKSKFDFEKHYLFQIHILSAVRNVGLFVQKWIAHFLFLLSNFNENDLSKKKKIRFFFFFNDLKEHAAIAIAMRRVAIAKPWRLFIIIIKYSILLL